MTPAPTEVDDLLRQTAEIQEDGDLATAMATGDPGDPEMLEQVQRAEAG